jgi:hypothetical protein
MFSLEYTHLFKVYKEILYEGLGRKTAFSFIKFGHKKQVLNRDRDFLKPGSGLQSTLNEFGFATMPKGPAKSRFFMRKGERNIVSLFYVSVLSSTYLELVDHIWHRQILYSIF